MNATTSLRSTIITLAALTLLTGAGAAFAAEKPAAKPAEQAAAPSPLTAVARVNGVDITRGEVERAKKILLSQSRMNQPMTADMTKQLEEAAVNQLVAKELLYQAGKKREIKDLDKKVQEKIAQNKARFPSPAEYEKALKEMEMSEKDVEAFAREDMIINNLIETEFVAKTKITDEEAKKFYDDNIDKFKQPETVRASHILIGADQKATAEDKKKARVKADEIAKKLKGGADFAELAKKESSCPSSAQGGDLGTFGKGQMVPEFEKATFALKPGETSGVVETQFGYHIIKLTEKKDAQTVKFEEVKERIVQYLTQQKVQKEIAGYVSELRNKGKVEILAN